FIVEEIPIEIEKSENGKYTIVQVRLKNWDTNRFVSVLARMLKISRKRITFAGTKDKKGVTVQYFCINGDYSNELEKLSDCEVLDVFRTDRMLRLGDLVGNKFNIFLNLDNSDSLQLFEANAAIVNNGGYWNLYGEQRFGTSRNNTHKIGELILRGDFERAAKLYLYDSEFDHEDFRVNISKNWNYGKALKEYPNYLSFERAIISHLNSGGKYEDSFDALPRMLA
ncbi:tRNA pseudouridine synthase D, partial [mine drainage metagenome]